MLAADVDDAGSQAIAVGVVCETLDATLMRLVLHVLC